MAKSSRVSVYSNGCNVFIQPDEMHKDIDFWVFNDGDVSIESNSENERVTVYVRLEDLEEAVKLLRAHVDSHQEEPEVGP